jgi:PmbA protein
LPNPDLVKTLDALLLKAKRAGAEEADGIVTYGRALSVSVRGGELEDIDNSEGRDVGLRVMIGGRQACVSSSDVSGRSLDQLAERAVAMAKLAPADPYCGLPDAVVSDIDVKAYDLYDDHVLSPDDLKSRALEVEAAALGVDAVAQAMGSSASFSQSDFTFGNSRGFRAGWASSRHGISTAAIAERDGAMERDYDYASFRHFADLPDPRKIGETAGKRAAARLGAEKIASGAMTVFYDQRKASSLLSALLGAINGNAITRGVSYLKDKMGEAVFNDSINIIDDPLMIRGLATRPCDGEGAAVQRAHLIKNGVLQQWLLNTSAAKQLGLTTTGHASRSVSHPPGIGASNVYLEAGALTPAAMFAEAGAGLLVTDMFGPNVNANTGDYSVGVSGFLIEGGQISKPVSEITIAGNLLEMFTSLTAANDLKFDSSVNAPTLRVEGMMVAGL